MADNRQKRCAVCGKRFRAASWNSAYCSDECRREAARRRREGGKVARVSSPGATGFEGALEELAPMIECVPDERRPVANEVAVELAFLVASCATLRQQLSAEGFTSSYDNGGGQSGTRQSPAWLSYNQALKHKLSYAKQLSDMVEASGGDVDELTEWLERT